MGGIEQGRPEGIATPEALGMLELLNLVEAQLWIKLEHEEEWRDPDYSHGVLLDAVCEEVPLSEESQGLLAAQVDNLERTRQIVLEILESGESPREILNLAFPEFENPPEPLEMIPTPYSFHFWFKKDDFNRFLQWERAKDDLDEFLTEGVAAFGLFSNELGIPISCRHEDLLSEPAAHVITAEFIDAMFPVEIDSERFNKDLDYAFQILENLVKRQLIIGAAALDEKIMPEPPGVLSFPSPITAHGQISRLYGEQAPDRLKEYTEELLKITWIVEQASIPSGRLPLLIANLGFGEIYERLPEAVGLYKEEWKRRKAEKEAFSHLTVSAVLSAVAGIGVCLSPELRVPAAVFLSFFGNDVRRILKHDKARQFTLLEGLGKEE